MCVCIIYINNILVPDATPSTSPLPVIWTLPLQASAAPRPTVPQASPSNTLPATPLSKPRPSLKPRLLGGVISHAYKNLIYSVVQLSVHVRDNLPYNFDFFFNENGTVKKTCVKFHCPVTECDIRK
jgi:hypothetical protein